MVVTDASWYVVRNTPRVTGFLGAGTTPIPVSKHDIDDLMKRMEVSEPEFTIDFEIGATVKITDGPFKGFEGKVSEIDRERGKIKVLVNMFGRDTPVELDSLQIKKV
jgi:transcriptional antiterminator NusG